MTISQNLDLNTCVKLATTLADVVVLIDNEYYDVFGVIDKHLITKEDYKALDTLSLLSNVRFYHYIKWSFINEECEDQLYHNDIN